MVGTVVGWIFAALGVLVLVLLFAPVVVGVSYREETFSLWVRVLFVRVRIYPAREKKPKAERRKAKKKEKKGKEKKPRPKRTLRQWLYLIKRIASSAGSAMGIAGKGLWIYDVDFSIAVHAGDAGDTAVRVGQLQAAVGGVRALLENWFRVRYKRLVVTPDFAGQMDHMPSFACKIAVCPVIMLIAGIVGLRAFRRYRKVYGPPPLSKEQWQELLERRERRAAEAAAKRGETAPKEEKPPGARAS